jgi:hypothetical protein
MTTAPLHLAVAFDGAAGPRELCTARHRAEPVAESALEAVRGGRR